MKYDDYQMAERRGRRHAQKEKNQGSNPDSYDTKRRDFFIAIYSGRPAIYSPKTLKTIYQKFS
jgi:hypothetical protein